MRKWNDLYYFIYSSHQRHELCYATSHRPDGDYTYRGAIISNGDIGYQGRSAKDRLAMTGTNHGSIERIQGQYYIFYHRNTHKTGYSRQGCAEPIQIGPDGAIEQVEMTSCGLNDGPLAAKGTYPAAIACNLTNGRMPEASHKPCKRQIPFISHDEKDRFITDITNGTRIGFKYFQSNGQLRLTIRGQGNGVFLVTRSWDDAPIAQIPVVSSESWQTTAPVLLPPKTGPWPLYLRYQGKGVTQLLQIEFL